MDKEYELWVNVDIQGRITDSYGGHKKYPSIPQEMIFDEEAQMDVYVEKQFDYYFEVDSNVFKTIDQYKVENGQLVLK